MEQYIDKSALVAEIKKLHGNPFYRMAIKDMLSILDTLEVKEVYLEKENFIKKEIGYIKGYREKAVKMLDELKAQKGEEV